MFLGFQLLEECFEQPRVTRRRDKAVLAYLVDAPDKSTRQTELDKLEPAPFFFLVARGNGTTLIDQGFDVALVFAPRFFRFR